MAYSSKGSVRTRLLQGLESLEDRRLLSVDGIGEMLHQGHGADDHWRHGIPFDKSDWTISTPNVTGRAGPLSQSEIFNLQSKPDSDFTIYLDFDGHVTTNTIWNDNYGFDVIESPPFDLDGDSTTFSQMELERILISWQRTAEDFAAFDVNVTTRDPGVDALINSGGGDSTWGARAVATFDTFANCGCGGHAFLNTFADSVDTPTFVYNLGEGSLGETFSHEVGHMLGLVHDGDSGQTYYPGHGNGAERWGAIMGAPFDGNITQWDRGEYFDSNNFEDDLFVITTQNGFGFRADDYGNSIANADPIDVLSGTAVHAYGVIETNTDRDYLSFETGAGTVSFDFDVLGTRPNLDVFAALYDSAGSLVAFDNPSNQVNASITASVAAGTYYLRVEGAGSNDVFNTGTGTLNNPSPVPWQNFSPTGYSDYGALGQYTINGTIVDDGANAFGVVATDAVKPEGASGTTPFTFTVTRVGNTSSAANVDWTVVDALPGSVGETSPDPVAPTDFAGGQSFAGVLNFAANETTKTLVFDVAGDLDFEFDEHFDVVLSDPSAGWGLSDSRASGIILSDDSRVGISAIGRTAESNEGPYDAALVRWRQIGAANGNFDEWAIDNVSLQNSTLMDDFDPIDNSNWAQIISGTVNNQFPGGTGNALTMSGSSDRQIITRFLNASPGDVLSFDIIFGDGSNGGENADPGEDVLLEFSLDGGSSWDEFAVFDTEDYTTWSSVQATLPTGIDTNPATSVSFTVVRDGGLSESTMVDWAVDTVGVMDPADGADFLGGVLPSGQVLIEAGASTAQVVLPLSADADFEPDEEFRLVLTGASSGTTLATGLTTGVGTIKNDDAAFNVDPGPQFRFRQLDNSGSDFDNWAIDNITYPRGQLSEDFDPDIDLTQWDAVSNGEVNNNFGGSGNSLYFTGGGQRSISTVTVDAQAGDTIDFDIIYGDDNNGGENPEDGEEVVLEYSLDGSNWTIMRTMPLNLTNWTSISEPIPNEALNPPQVATEGSTFTFKVQRFGIDTALLESTVTWQVVGSGINPADANDFPGGVFPSGTLDYEPGESVLFVDVPVLDDGAFEADETFDLVVNASGGNPVGTATILNNDDMPNGDFDNDGDYDCDDIDALVENIINQANITQYDMNGDNALDLTDRDEWLSVAGSVNLPSQNPYLLGDANLDGLVDGLDFISWNDNKFSTGNYWCGGDFNADNVTDGLDFIIWNDNKFTMSDASSVAPNQSGDSLNQLVDSSPIVNVNATQQVSFNAPSSHETEEISRNIRRTEQTPVAELFTDNVFAEQAW